jgi:polysaccharide biosynthesis protein PslG
MRKTVSILAVLLSLSVATVLADVSSPYGINSHAPDSATLDLIAAAGIGWIRVDMNWFQMEPGRDTYDWGFMDAVINNARARGLEVFATLAYTPAWANGTGNIADPPIDTGDWYDFVYDTVNRYKYWVKYWGMWNEPNLESFFTGVGWQYREWILKPGAQAAKHADPGCYVLGPELAHLNSADYPSWMYEAMAAGGSDYIDIVTHHCYKGTTGQDVFLYLDQNAFYWPWDPPPLMKVLSNLGVTGKPVWLTEVGWGTDGVSEEEQADYYHQVLWGVLQRDYLDKVFFYEIRDDPTPGVTPWGIVRSDYSPKQAYYRYAEYIDSPTAPPTPPSPCGHGLFLPAGGLGDLAAALLVLAWMAAVRSAVRRKPAV